jgi:hypothetical protein
MKTLIIYNDIESPLQFLLVDGDYSRFHGVMVNALNGNGFEGEFCDWMFDKETGERNHLGQWSDDKSLLENKNWDKVAICTWIP